MCKNKSTFCVQTDRQYKLNQESRITDRSSWYAYTCAKNVNGVAMNFYLISFHIFTIRLENNATCF